MSKVINLNRFRKRKAKEKAVQVADQNRRIHGRTTAERVHEARQKEQFAAKLAGSRLENKEAQTPPSESEVVRDKTEGDEP